MTNNMGIGERFTTCAIQLFEEIQSMLREKPSGKMMLQLVIPLQQDVHIYSGLSALLKTAQLEHPGFIGQIIELDAAGMNQAEMDDLLEANSHFPGDHWVRYQEGERYVAGWTEAESAQNDFTIPWVDHGVYLITGGAGELGLLFAKEIAREAKEGTVVLAGRSPFNEKIQASLSELTQSGVHAVYRQADVADEGEVVRLVRSMCEEFGGIHGIIHSAGIVRDDFIIRKTKEQFTEVLAPKVTGLLNLDFATAGLELDFFILFSSTAGILGNPGQADYAAANAFMDAYTKYRNSLVAGGLRKGRTLSVNWPLWKEGGMQIDPKLEQMIGERTGMLAIEKEEGIRALYQSMASGSEQVAVIKGDTRTLQGAPGAPGPQEEVSITDGGKPDRDGVHPSGDELERKAAAFVTKLLSSVIKLPPARIHAEVPFEQYGTDSILVMQMTNQLEQVFGPLPKTLFFEYPNIAELTAYLLQVYPERLEEKLGSAAQKPAGNKRAEAAASAEAAPSPLSPNARARLKPREEPPDSTMDIAIIGLAGRYPGASDIREFWDNLKEGKDSITEIPSDRWDYRQYLQGNWGGFLDGVDHFDPLFFSISPREAEQMDPQERLFLQCVYETFEDAGYAPRTANADACLRAVGVFVGVMYEEYQLYGAQEQAKGRMITLSGNPSSIANRVSYFFDFHGPSIAIDTMCSSSLTGIHLACQSIRSGDCELAIAGGVNVSVHPNKYLALGQSHFMSSKGRCESFGEGGDGYVPGEGVGAVLLKPLAKAAADGDHIYGVVKGSAINHGGRSNGYTVPNPNAQASVIDKALKAAGINPRTVSYIEAHGTGTFLGDPIEIAGLTKAFQAYTKDKQYCAIGSVKSNIGHGESSAGIAGLTKVLLQLRHRQLAPSLHAKVLNPHIDFGQTPFMVQQEYSEWKRPLLETEGGVREFPRVAGISSFGAGGSNAHLLVEEYIPEQAASGSPAAAAGTTALIVLSAKNEGQLRSVAERLLEAAREWPLTDEDLSAVAYTLQTGREPMEARLAVQVDSMKELEAKLEAYLDDQALPEDVFVGQAKLMPSGLDGYSNDSDMEETMAAWVRKKKYGNLLKLWVNGLPVNWNFLYGGEKPGRISLPTYPFAKGRYWFSTSKDGGQEAEKAQQPDLTAADMEPIAYPQRSLPPVDAAGKAASGRSNKPSGIALAPVASPATPAALRSAEPSSAPARSASVIRLELTSSLAAALFIDSVQIDPDRKFVDLGMDSIIGVEWVRTINQTYGTSFSATVLYDYPTIRQLAGLLQNERTEWKLPDAVSFPSVAAGGKDRWDMAGHSLSRSRQGTVEKVRGIMTSTLAQALYLNAADIDKDHKFMDMGMDSVIGAEWIRSVNQALGTTLPATVIYDYPTVRELAGFVAAQAGAAIEGIGLKHVQAVPMASGASDIAVEPRGAGNAPSSEIGSEAPTPEKPANREAVAIIGISGRYPGAEDVHQYWQNLAAGKNSVREIPQERWDMSRYDNGEDGQTGPMYCRWLGSLDDIECFDPLFFNISPGEAEMIDPQQRIFLQEAYKAFEDAGYGPDALNNQKCGVYLGIMGNEYGGRTSGLSAGIARTTSNSAAIAAARIPYFLNLKGPAISVDTACSSSLVAAHLACQALVNREVNIALVGGVTLYLSPDSYLDMCSAGMLSPDGQCKSFDNSANGFVPGEGAGALVLKRLEDAEADRDHIYGVIIGSGINQDGKTNGITAPSMNSQMELVRDIYRKYDISPASISYAEMHGTGTKLGDPIELEALSNVYRAYTDDKQFCAIGSVKSNIGHTSAAAGIAGIHKVLMSLKHQMMVPTLHVKEPNEHFSFENSPFYINTDVRPLEGKAGSKIRCSVSAFGYSGTNTHLVIEEYRKPVRTPKPGGAGRISPVLLTLSAQSPEQLKRYAGAMKSWLERERDADLQDAAYTLQVGRGGMDYRLAIMARTIEEAKKGFDDFIHNRPSDRLWSAKAGSDGQRFETEEEARLALLEWLRSGRLDLAAEAWVRGQSIDWSLLYGNEKPSRISLPTYPFAKERCWIAYDGGPTSGGHKGDDRPAVLHPLLHRNVSDFSGTRFSSVFTGKEFFLADHTVRGERILSGAACLEMVRSAIQEAANLSGREIMVRLQEIVWHRPLVCGDRPLKVQVRLAQTGDSTADFEICSGAEGESAANSAVYCSGHAELAANAGKLGLNMNTLLEQCQSAVLSSRECYDAFERMGIVYGESHRGINEIYLGADQALAKLSLNPAASLAQDACRLYPGIIDSAFQASIGLVYGSADIRLSVPYSLRSVDILRETGASDMWAWVRYSGDERKDVDIDICDEEGQICVVIRGLSTWTQESAPTEDDGETEFLIQLSKQIAEGDWSEEEVEQILRSRIEVGGAYV